jgi:acyl-CoA thioester hydrolase
MTLPANLSAFPVVVEIPVQWGEMDAYGHVNNAVFFRYFETARVEYLERCGFLESFHSRRVGAILHSTQCRFRHPVRHPDALLVGAKTSEMSEDRFTMDYLAISMATGEVAAEGSAVVVSFDYATGSKTPLPPLVRDEICKLERLSGDLH